MASSWRRSDELLLRWTSSWFDARCAHELIGWMRPFRPGRTRRRILAGIWWSAEYGFNRYGDRGSWDILAWHR
jgi:hypothetical protein